MVSAEVHSRAGEEPAKNHGYEQVDTMDPIIRAMYDLDDLEENGA